MKIWVRMRRFGEANPNYKKIPSYSIVHSWLNRYFGKARKCEDKNCFKKSKTFDYALKKGKSYSRNRLNFIQLCRSCHLRYDYTRKRRRKMSNHSLSRERNYHGQFV